MKLFFDLETTGLPLQKEFDIWYPPEELDKYESSRIIEIGIIIVHKEKIIYTFNSLIKPDNFKKLEPIITKITGITDDDILKEGKDLNEIFKIIKDIFQKFPIKVINSYNINFDYNVLLSEAYRIHDNELIKILKNVKKECTLQIATKHFKMDKYPKLENVYKILFKEDPKQDHRAFGDAILCKEVYYKIKNNIASKSLNV